MIYQDEEEIREAVREFIDLSKWVDPFAVTLTLKKCCAEETIAGPRKVWLTGELASQNLRHFLNGINCRLYKNRFKRFHARVRVFPVLEGDSWLKR